MNEEIDLYSGFDTTPQKENKSIDQTDYEEDDDLGIDNSENEKSNEQQKDEEREMNGKENQEKNGDQKDKNEANQLDQVETKTSLTNDEQDQQSQIVSQQNELDTHDDKDGLDELNNEPQFTERKIVIENLGWWISDQQIIQLLESFGTIESLSFEEEEENGKSKGICTVWFVEPESAYKSYKALDKTIFEEQEIKINYEEVNKKEEEKTNMTIKNKGNKQENETRGIENGMNSRWPGGFPVPQPPIFPPCKKKKKNRIIF
eukprot:Anaeramoba_ignava/c19053_g1_i1.p1 GENE.c19053_g1_i1~~c19053_g1_i1.p1  ORF type:complete len:261 (+),score=111.63 c19053_g1_i1:57-839(+)